MMKRGQSLVEASMYMFVFSFVLLAVWWIVSAANDAQARAMNTVSLYVGRLVAARGDPYLWNCSEGKWENAEPSIGIPFVLSHHIGINPSACKVGYSPPADATCVNYYLDGTRLFSLPCREMDTEIYANGQLWGRVRIVGTSGVYWVVVTREINNKTFRHSVLVSDCGGGQ